MQGLGKKMQGLGKLCTKLDRLSNWIIAGPHATKATVVTLRTPGGSNPGKWTTFRLCSTDLDNDTGRGKLSPCLASLRNGRKTKTCDIDTMTYQASFILDASFGIPGAIVVKNEERNEFFLKFVTLEMPENHSIRSIHFDCNSWIYPFRKTNADRVFFANASYLPSKTPLGLQDRRQEELVSLRGNGRGERKEWERIYDYDYYNDLGEPQNGPDHARPVLGGSTYPYPRRCRTGRPLSGPDLTTETRNKSINLDFYVPPDERFSPMKLSEFISNSIRAAVHFVIPELNSLFERRLANFDSWDQIKNDLYSRKRNRVIDGPVMKKLKAFLPHDLFKEVSKVIKCHPIKFPIPQVIAADESAWKTDEEFGREMLAGINPAVIRRLEKFPPEGRRGNKSSITASQIVGKLGVKTADEVVKDGKILILDHHDYLMPYLRRIKDQGVCAYASRTLLLVKGDGTLEPLIIELSLPVNGEEVSRVILPESQQELWRLAKTHVAVNDSIYHQLISHWLFTHAVVEPFIIATRRQLSTMHPIYKLLDPHFKDTMHINSLARGILLNAGGILEKTTFPGKFALEISSKIYEDWRFSEQGLPEDLVKRGFAVKDTAQPSGVRLTIADYPYAADGLDVWTAIKTWVTNYCMYFYEDDQSVITDVEIQEWWNEVCQVGHGDKRDDQKCWLPLDSRTNLIQILTTLIWIASALHAAVNFGQYGYAGYPPNRPSRCRKFIPAEGTPEFADFLRDPNTYHLEMLPDRFTTMLATALIEMMSWHTADEVYLGQRASTAWTDDQKVLKMFEEFEDSLLKVEKKIDDRNRDQKLKNRWGPTKVPYTLLFPDTSNLGTQRGVSGKGIPNSVSI